MGLTIGTSLSYDDTRCHRRLDNRRTNLISDVNCDSNAKKLPDYLTSHMNTKSLKPFDQSTPLATDFSFKLSDGTISLAPATLQQYENMYFVADLDVTKDVVDA